MNVVKSLLLCVATLVCLTGSVNADLFTYSDLTGDDVMYTAISENTGDIPNALFGAPSIAGNTMDFDPLQFSTGVNSSTGTSASETVDAQLNFTVMSISDTFGIEQIIINEAGDYTLNGLGSAALANASVSAPVLYEITHVDGVALTTPISGSDSLSFSPSGGSYTLADDGIGTGVPWTGSLTLDLGGLANMGKITKVEIALDNTLTVAAADGGSAFIAKKEGGVTIQIPEPSSLSLLGLGLLLCIRTMRRS